MSKLIKAIIIIVIGSRKPGVFALSSCFLFCAFAAQCFVYKFFEFLLHCFSGASCLAYALGRAIHTSVFSQICKYEICQYLKQFRHTVVLHNNFN